MELASRMLSFLKKLLLRRKGDAVSFADLFVRFQDILKENNRAMGMIADMDSKQSGEFVFDSKYLEDTVNEIEKSLMQSAYNFNLITDNKYLDICSVIEALGRRMKMELAGQVTIPDSQNVLALEEIQEAMNDTVGNKAYNLFRILNLPQANVPKSFVVSIGGFQQFLAFNNLYERIDAQLEQYEKGASSEITADTIRLMVLNGDIPSGLRKEILRSAEGIHPQKPESGFYSVRSSALGEDGILSFAGLHDSFLNVPFRELLSSYKKVLASLYKPESLEYRLNHGIPLSDMAMAVLYQEMVPAKSAGVVYTLDPNSSRERVCVIGANWGLGKSVVEGTAAVDTFRVSRDVPHVILETRINEKKRMVGFDSDRKSIRVEKSMRNQPCLTPEQASAIVETAMIIERFFKRPMDIEWCLDRDDRLTILQARPLGLPRGGHARSQELNAVLKKQTVLLKDQGIIAYRGVGAGPVCVVDDKKSIERFPSGSVLVARFGIPLLSRAIPRASAVITDIGSPTGHMATVAREFQIPTIVDAGSATQILKPGQEITVDAEKNMVYQGRIDALLHHQLLERSLFEIRYEFQILRRLLRRLSPLTLVDPEDSNFTPRECRTFHDIIRFIHEKSIQALLSIAQKPSSLMARGGKRLKSPIPLDLILIDIGGGIEGSPGRSGWVLPAQIRSTPMNALWAGIDSDSLWNTEPVPADFKGLMAGVTRTQTSVVAGQTLTGLNIAVLGTDYMNLTLRVGYHFTVVDSHMDPDSGKNSIFFRFVGGATDISRRSRRASLLVRILEKIGFKVEGNGDLVIARAVSPNADQISRYLYLVGRLIGFVRQLDILMKDDSAVDLYFDRFMTANAASLCSDQPSAKEIVS